MRTLLRLSILLVTLLAIASVAAAQLSYDIIWSATPGGGGSSRGGPYTLEGSILTSAGVMTGDGLVLHSGFWSSQGRTGNMMPRLWLPVLLRGQAR